MKQLITIEVIMGNHFHNDFFAGNQEEKPNQKGLAAILLSTLYKQKLASEKLYLLSTHEVADFCLN